MPDVPRFQSTIFCILLLISGCQREADSVDGELLAAIDDAVTISEDSEVIIEPLVNDIGEAIQLESFSLPEKGRATVDGDRISYLPSPDFSGTDSISYLIVDAAGKEARGTISITVVAVNDPPQAIGEQVAVAENGQVEIDVLLNDRDSDGDPLTVAAVSKPNHGAASVTANNTLIYAPAPLFNGSDSFTYTVTDPDGAQSIASVTVEVSGENDPPVAMDDLVTLQQGEAVTLDLLANDRDPEGDVLTIELVRGPRRGKLDDGFRYTASVDYNGYDEFSYRVTDPAGASAEATVRLTVYEKREPGAPIFQLPRTSLQPEELAVIVNDNDPVSVAIAPYYAAKRGIPAANIIRISVPDSSNVLSPAEFSPLLEQVEQALPEGIQAYALTWIKPYRVGCMSITSAFALGGYDAKYCNTSGTSCSVTAAVDYYASESTRPFDDHGIRPAMVLAGVTDSDIRALIDRGVAADNSFPSGTGYLVRTTDSRRSVRWSDFQSVTSWWDHEGGLELFYRDNSDGKSSNLIENRTDVLFYFTGLTRVAGIETNSYRPGAIADHLTSAGGVLTATGGQMSVVRWLEAGVTASYGTVVEPCNYVAKFPVVSSLLPMYFRGNTLLEAYWKSVQQPGEGIFVGEPLARPWGRAFLRYLNGDLILRTTLLSPEKRYAILAADTPDGDFRPVMENITIDSYRLAEITVPGANRPVYKLVEQ